MSLASTAELLRTAQAHNTAVAAFNVLHLETAEGLTAAAEATGLPVILQISENCVRYHGALDPIATATLAIARSSTVPVAVHLDHAEEIDLAFRAIDLGFSSVMYDGSKLEYSDNVAATRRVVEYATTGSVLVEAELGEVGGKNGAHTPGVRTDPREAECFVAETGVGALAVAVGSSHAMTERVAVIDVDLIGRLRDSVAVPLVLHGSSGVSDALIVRGIRAGLSKINVSTHLNRIFTNAITAYFGENPTTVDSRRYLAAARTALGEEAARLLTLFASH